MNNEEYFELIDNFYKKKEKYDNWEKVEKKEFYSKIESAFKNENKLSFVNGKNGYNVTKVVNTKTEYDIPKLKDRLNRRLLQKILIKNINVIDSKAFIDLLKKFNVKKEETKGIFEIQYKIDEKELEQQLQLGNIKRREISEAMKIVQNPAYFKVERIEKKR